MKKLLYILTALLLFSSHDMFFKLDSYFLQPNTAATIKLFNGTFENSENVIDRDRMIDASLVGNGQRTRVDTTQWTERDSATILNFKTGAAGTWVAGLSTRSRNIELDAKSFNDYLEHDGVLDMIELRKQKKLTEQDAVEKYSKHVKTIFQVGEQRSDDWQTVLGYPIEFIPARNPYTLQIGESLPVQLLRAGQPLANQLVHTASDNAVDAHQHDHDHAAGESHHHHGTAPLRTDAQGMVNVELTHAGQWYLRTIHLVETTEAGLTHESNWATLTFGVAPQSGNDTAHRHGAGHSHSHEDGHSHSHGAMSYVYWIGGIVLLIGAFVWLRRSS